jgi:hypothetical protein
MTSYISPLSEDNEYVEEPEDEEMSEEQEIEWVLRGEMQQERHNAQWNWIDVF